MSSFAAILAASASQNAAKQAAIAKADKERQVAQRKLELENHRKAELAKQAADERRREREAREAKAALELQLRKEALPKTNNLYQLKQERIKRGLNPDGSEDHLAGGPSSAPKTVAKQSYTDLLKNATKSKPMASSANSKSKGKAKEAEPVGLTRAEKAARKRDALFRDDEPSSGAFALAKSMKAREEGSESPRPSTSTSKSAAGSRASTSTSIASPRPGSPASALSKKRHLDIPTNPKSSSLSRTSSSSSLASNTASTAPSGSARDRLKAGFKPNSLQKLYTVKRDTRTIEEVERDLKAKKKAGRDHGGTASTSATTNATRALPSAAAMSSSSRPRSNLSSTTADPPRAAKPLSRPRRSRSSSSGSDDTDSDDDDDDSISDSSSSSTAKRRRTRRRQKKRARQGKADLNEGQRDAIWKLMGRDRSKYAVRDSDSDESDMEVSGAQLLAEERRAARLSAKEDAEEQEKLRIAAEKKKQLKAAAKTGPVPSSGGQR